MAKPKKHKYVAVVVIVTDKKYMKKEIKARIENALAGHPDHELSLRGSRVRSVDFD